jgi:hypothetical protein
MHFQKFFALLICVFSLGGGAIPTYAQDQQTNIEGRVDALTSGAPRIVERPDEAILTGREDLVLLMKRQLFEAYINPSFQYTNNAFLSNANRESDKMASLTGGLRFSTVVANKFNVFADLSMTGARYQSFDQLNYNIIQGSVGASYVNGPWVGSLSYSPTYVYDDNMKDHLVSLHRLSAYFSRSFIAHEKIILSPFILAQATPSDPNEYGFYQGDIGVQAVVTLPHYLRLSAGPRVYVKKYFNYFESITGESREDKGIGVSASLSWNPNPKVALSFNTSFTSNNSNLQTNDYDAFTASPSLRLAVKF